MNLTCTGGGAKFAVRETFKRLPDHRFVLNQTLAELKLGKHPDKTFIGKSEKGFDFLGYHFSPDGLSIAEKTIENFFESATRLLEQKPGGDGSSRLELYVRRWVRWVEVGFGAALGCELMVKANIRPAPHSVLCPEGPGSSVSN